MNVWMLFCLGTVLCWGAYGPTLHAGNAGFGDADKANNSYRAMLCVGAAYFLVAVIIPLIILASKGSLGGFNIKGTTIATAAGCLGALGATCIIWSFKNGGVPITVMALVFGAAPIVNAVVSVVSHPPKGGLASLDFRLFVGVALVAVGGYLVMAFKP